MKPSHKAFYFLIDMEEWELARIFGSKLDVDKTHFNLLKLIIGEQPKRYVRRGRSIMADCPMWLFDITPTSILEYNKFIIDNDIDDYYSQKLTESAMYKIFERRFNSKC